MKASPLFFILALFAGAGAVIVRAGTPVGPVPRQARLRVATVQVRVAPDRWDWTYAQGEAARFRIQVMADNEPVQGAIASYSVGPEMMPAKTVTAPVPPEGLVVDAGTLRQPGFLRCIATSDVAGHTYRGLATAAFDPEKIVATQVEPADFDAFWQSGLAELAKVPMEAKLALLPDSCTSTVNVYHVSFRTVGPTWNNMQGRIYGILCEPKAPGRYPAVLEVPGAGARPYFGDTDLASHGVITLQIGIHGIPVNLPLEVYDQLMPGALNGYWTYNLDNREAYYYRRVYLSCVRADDFLVSRPMWDGKRLLVMGASQGGQLSIVTAALDRRVIGLSVTHPAFCDVSAELHGRAGGWPHPFQPDPVTGKPSPNATADKIATATYYDTVNFARRVRVPGYYNWGYNDEVCPPTSTYAAYNAIDAPKELGLTLELGHSYTKEQGEAIYAWVERFLGVQ